MEIKSVAKDTGISARKARLLLDMVRGKSVDEAKENIKEAIMLYMEDVYEAGDEKEFIPRPAPVEEWLKYFKQKALEIKNDVLKKNTPILSEVVIG